MQKTDFSKLAAKKSSVNPVGGTCATCFYSEQTEDPQMLEGGFVICRLDPGATTTLVENGHPTRLVDFNWQSSTYWCYQFKPKLAVQN